MKKFVALIFVGMMIFNNPGWATEEESQKVNTQVSPTVNFGEEKVRPIISGRKEIASGFQDLNTTELHGLNLNELNIKNREQANDSARRIPSF